MSTIILRVKVPIGLNFIIILPGLHRFIDNFFYTLSETAGWIFLNCFIQIENFVLNNLTNFQI